MPRACPEEIVGVDLLDAVIRDLAKINGWNPVPDLDHMSLPVLQLAVGMYTSRAFTRAG
jgi:hypothetical protein